MLWFGCLSWLVMFPWVFGKESKGKSDGSVLALVFKELVLILHRLPLPSTLLFFKKCKSPTPTPPHSPQANCLSECLSESACTTAGADSKVSSLQQL